MQCRNLQSTARRTDMRRAEYRFLFLGGNLYITNQNFAPVLHRNGGEDEENNGPNSDDAESDSDSDDSDWESDSDSDDSDGVAAAFVDLCIEK